MAFDFNTKKKILNCSILSTILSTSRHVSTKNKYIFFGSATDEKLSIVINANCESEQMPINSVERD